MYSLGAYSFIFTACWVIWLGFWILTWSWSKPTVNRETDTEGLLYQVLLVAGFVLLISSTSSVPVLNIRLIPNTITFIEIGAIISILGLLCLIGARVALADNWSSKVEFKKDHKLVERGPYAFVRHPIYTGLLLMFLGTAVAAGTIASLLAVILALISCLIKLDKEEKLLNDHFPEDYPKYKARTNALIPFIY